MFNGIDHGDGVLAGPVIGIPIGDMMSISLSGLFGKQSTHWSLPYDNRIFDTGSAIPSEGTYMFDEIRYDIDAALSFNVLEHVKIFAGYKYQYLDITFEFTEVRWDTNAIISYNTVNATFPSHCIAAGVGLNYTFSDIFFVTGNLSLLYGLQSEFDITLESEERDNNGNLTSSSFKENKIFSFRLWGINAEPSIGAKIGSSLIGTLGARFQFLQYESERTEINTGINKGDKLNDYLYGIFVGVMYLI